MDVKKSNGYLEHRRASLGIDDIRARKELKKLKNRTPPTPIAKTSSMSKSQQTVFLSTPLARNPNGNTSISTPATVTPIPDKKSLLNNSHTKHHRNHRNHHDDTMFTTITTTTSTSNNKYKKKPSICSNSLLYISYFTSIYAIVAYTSISILSINELVKTTNSQLIPLYMLVIGYITVAIMSFNLLLALYKDYISIVLCWIVTLSVFILPEIALNIVLAETVLNWFKTSTGSYMTILLICRVSINIPGLIIVLMYYLQKTKRESKLKRMLKPIKQNILNGEIMKRYENVPIDDIKDDLLTLNSDHNNNSNMSKQTTVNETIIQRAIDAFIAKLDENLALEEANQLSRIPNELPIETANGEHQRILISEKDKLKLLTLKRQLESKRLNKSVEDKANYALANNQKPLYSRYSEQQHQHQQQAQLIAQSLLPKAKINEIKVDLKKNEEIEIDIDKFKTKTSQVQIDIEKPLNSINIDYNKNTNEIRINVLNPVGLKSRPPLNHLVYLPPSSTDSNEKLYDTNNNHVPQSNVQARVSSSCNCVNISCSNINEQLLHDKKCYHNNRNILQTFKPPTQKQLIKP